jgi:hypothetical protein
MPLQCWYGSSDTFRVERQLVLRKWFMLILCRGRDYNVMYKELLICDVEIDSSLSGRTRTLLYQSKGTCSRRLCARTVRLSQQWCSAQSSRCSPFSSRQHFQVSLFTKYSQWRFCDCKIVPSSREWARIKASLDKFRVMSWKYLVIEIVIVYICNIFRTRVVCVRYSPL